MNWLAITMDGNLGITLVIGMFAWFAQMGFHEGGHAWTAYWLGDKTAYHMGKRTVNPIAHVNWNDWRSVLASVGVPAITVLTWGFPLGMAWVPVNPSNFRHPYRDHAIVSLAGPGGGFLVALIILMAWIALFPLFGGEQTAAVAVLESLLRMTYVTAVIYSVFNLVPIPPLDGSNVIYYLGNHNLRQFMNRIRPYGFFIIIIVFWILPGGVFLAPAFEALLWPFENLPGVIWGV